MKCLENLDRIKYPSELVMDLTKLYRFKGKDFYYEDIFKSTMTNKIRMTIEKDTFYAAKLLNLNLTESRTRLIIKKDSTPKTKDERVLANLKEVFSIIQKKGDDLELETNEFLRLAKRIFNEVTDIDFASEIQKVQNNLLEDKKRVSKREYLDKELKLYKRHLLANNVEATQLITNFYVDLLNLNVYTKYNEFLALLILYCLLFRERFNLFKYVSFFQIYFENKDEFENITVGAKYDWEHGYSQTAPLNKYLIKRMLEGYQTVENQANNFKLEKNIKKRDNVESVILKLGEIFTKEQIKNACPNLSDSTINRALKNLKDENKIAPNGTGRNATWIKLVEEEMFGGKMKQMTLFDMIMVNESEE